MKQKLYSVIIAGGAGTRFWPLSRSRHPKQLLKLFGPKSLIEETATRARSLSAADKILVITVADQSAATRRELRLLPRANFLAEPEGKNTAACIGLAALEVMNRDPDAVMIVLPADHWVPDIPAFRRTLKAAAETVARYDLLVTIGIKPAYPETGYGYIVKGQAISGTSSACYRVTAFKEKPDAKLARRLIRKGSLWNAGIFVWKASTLLALIERYQPVLHDGLINIRKAALGKSLANPARPLSLVIAREYKKLPAISIDHAVLEKAGSESKVLTIEANFAWSDVGSWAAVHRMSERDSSGNAGNGKWLGVGAKDCMIHAPDRLIVLLGVQELAIIDTPDALLVGHLKRSQDVREVVDQLKKSGYGSYTVK